jgi:hypothetical protein
LNKEELVKILESEELKSSSEKVDAINKMLAENTIPKDKFNELNGKLKSAEDKYNSINKEYEEYKMSKMTDEEKKNAEKEEMANRLLQYQMDLNRLEVEKIFESNGLKEDDYKAILPNIIGKDRDASIASANNFITILRNNTERVEQATKQSLLQQTPTPIGGSSNTKTSSNLEDLQTAYAEAIKNKDQVAQAKLLREIQIEKSKSNQPIN